MRSLGNKLDRIADRDTEHLKISLAAIHTEINGDFKIICEQEFKGKWSEV